MPRLDVVRAKIRGMMHDTDAQAPAIVGDVLDDCISSHMQTAIGSMGHEAAWITLQALSVGDGEYDVTPSAAEFHTIALLRLATSGFLVEKVSAELFERAREGGNTTVAGVPMIACITEEPASSASTYRRVNLRLWPVPNQAENLEALVSVMPVSISADSDGLPLSELATRGLECAAAAELLASLSPDECARIKISKDVVSLWQKRSDDAYRHEKIRVARMRRSRGLNMSTSG